jgi:hypothetical protein
MSDYRRNYVPGGTYFFTVVTYQRRRMLTDELARSCLHESIEEIQKKWHFDIVAIVLLPRCREVMTGTHCDCGVSKSSLHAGTWKAAEPSWPKQNHE